MALQFVRRLITCQGSAQLVTAVAALRAHDSFAGPHGDGGSNQDHLLIYGLSVPAAQTPGFVRFIEAMARLIHRFESVVHLSDQQVDALWRGAGDDLSSDRLVRQFSAVLGVDCIDEVFVVREWQRCNALVLNAFPMAAHICYGDSVGVYLPPDYAAGPASRLARVRSALRKLIRCPENSSVATPRLDRSYLLLPDAFGKPPSGKVVRTDAAVLRSLFGQLTPLLSRNWCFETAARARGGEVWVLMGSNFSEQGVMSLAQEIAAYRDWISSLAPPAGTLLLLKSHPRDESGKHEVLVNSLRGLFGEVVSADAAGSPYLPSEVFLLELARLGCRLRALTFSSACLGAHFVLSIPTVIGFGEDIIARYIEPRYRAARCRHESDLRRLCATQ